MIAALLLLAALASPQPSAGPMSCAVPNRDAIVDDTDFARMTLPDLPTDLRIAASVFVKADGSVEKVEIVQGSGDFTVDNRVVDYAKHLHFKPKLRDCVPVSGTYTLRVLT
jgi:TonB family protein